MLGNFIEKYREITNLVKIGQKYRALYMKASVPFLDANDIKPLSKRSD
jgi:hypothetical protein